MCVSRLNHPYQPISWIPGQEYRYFPVNYFVMFVLQVAREDVLVMGLHGEVHERLPEPVLQEGSERDHTSGAGAQ